MSLCTCASSPAASLLAQPAQETICVRRLATILLSLSPLGELFVDTNQLVFGSEVDLDPAARAVPDDAHACAEEEFEFLFRSTCVHVHRFGGRGLGRRRALDRKSVG